MGEIFTIVVRNTKFGADYIGLNAHFCICRFVNSSASLKLYMPVSSSEK